MERCKAKESVQRGEKMNRIFKKGLVIVLALAMVFAMSATVFADTSGSVSVNVTVNGVSADTFTYTVGTNTNVKDVLSGHYSTNSAWSGDYLQSITLNSVTYASAPYIPVSGAFDDSDIYVAGVDTYLDSLNAQTEFSQYGGIYMDASSMLGNGYFFMGDMQHTCYIGSDWTYKVDYAADGYGNPVVPGEERTGWYDNFYQYTMAECTLSAGDTVHLTYDLSHTIF